MAARDAAGARSTGAQKSAGNTADVSFDILSVTAQPLEGSSDFIAFEKLRSHSSGSIDNLVELYHQDDRSAPWTACDRAFFASNIELPILRLNTQGFGHVLSPEEVVAQTSQSVAIADRYVAAVSATSGRPTDGAFVAGEFTSGEVASAVDFMASASDHGSGSRKWVPGSDGKSVALTKGVLTFAALQEVQELHKTGEGQLTYFVNQDSKRVNLNGLLDPGNYVGLTSTSSVTVAVVTNPPDLPDVVGRDAQVVSIQGQLDPA